MSFKNKFNDRLRNECNDGADELLKQIKAQNADYFSADKRRSKAFGFKKRFAYISALATAAVCCAIVLPIALKPVQNSPELDPGYCDTPIQDFYRDFPGVTIKEYNEIYGTDMRYIDWYDFAEYQQLTVFRSTETDEVIYYNEEMFHDNPEEFVIVDIIQKDKTYKWFDSYQTGGTIIYINGIECRWFNRYRREHVCVAIYGDYRYYLYYEFYEHHYKEPDRVFELMENLLFGTTEQPPI